MAESRKENALLHEWITANTKIDNIDARIWQGAGILLVISIGGFSIINWNPPMNLGQYIPVIAIAIISIIVLLIWHRIYQRWMYIQSIYGHRIREIETRLGLHLNLIARTIEYWDSREDTKSYISHLQETDNNSYLILCDFRKLQTKKKYGRTPLYKSLNVLTLLLIVIWVSIILIYTILFFNDYFIETSGNSAVSISINALTRLTLSVR